MYSEKSELLIGLYFYSRSFFIIVISNLFDSNQTFDRLLY